MIPAIGILLAAAIFFGALFIVRTIQYQNLKEDLLTYMNKLKPFEKKRYVMTENEQKYFQALHKVFSDSYYIFPQLHLSSFLKVSDKIMNKYFTFKTLDDFSVDFVLVDKTMQPIVVIELNDSSHNPFPRKNRDEFVKKVIEDAGIRFHTSQTQNSYEDEVARIAESLKTSL